MAGKIQVPSVNSEKYSPDSSPHTREKYKAKFAIELLPTLFVHSSSNKQALRVLFFDHGKTQKFGYFCPFCKFLFFSFRTLFAVYMFSFLLPFMAAKTFVFCVSKHLSIVSGNTFRVLLPSDTSAAQ